MPGNNGMSLRKQTTATCDDVVARLPDALKAQGFGVLTEIDMQATLKAKIGADIRRYKIFGACNPPFAHQALGLDLDVGLMMPCNVVVYEDDAKHAVVLAVDPTGTVGASGGHPGLAELAAGIKAKLSAVLASL